MSGDAERLSKQEPGRRLKPVNARASNEDAGNPGAESKILYWRDRLKRWRSSGLTKSAFCRQESLRINTFNLWNLRLSGDETVETQTEFTPEIENAQSKSALCAETRAIVAEISDVSGKNRLTIYDGASPEAINAIISTFLR